MRHGLWAAMVLLLAAHASAQGKKDDKDKKGEEKKPGAGLMEQSGSDPSGSETLDEGPYAPTGKTGKLKGATPDAGEREEIQKRKAKKPFLVFPEVLIGFGKAPGQTNAPLPPGDTFSGDATVYGLLVGGSYDFSPEFSAGLRGVFSNGVVKQVRGSNVGKNQATFAIGAPELFCEYRIEAGPLTRIPLHFAVGIPVTQGDADPTSTATDKQAQAEVQRVADAASGWRDGELYQPGRLPVTLRGGVDYHKKTVLLFAYEKVILLPKVKGSISNPGGFDTLGTFDMNGFAMRSVTAAGMEIDVVADKAFLGADAWGVVNIIDPVDFNSAAGAERPGKFQLVFEPRLGGRFGMLTPSLGFIWPIGGPIDNQMKGLRVKADIAF